MKAWIGVAIISSVLSACLFNDVEVPEAKYPDITSISMEVVGESIRVSGPVTGRGMVNTYFYTGSDVEVMARATAIPGGAPTQIDISVPRFDGMTGEKIFYGLAVAVGIDGTVNDIREYSLD